MKILELHLQDYRGVTEATVSFPATGVTIVEGDNEAGKTSLTQALDLVLTTRDDSRCQAVRDSQPIGRDVGPLVRVHLQSGPYRLELTKRWWRRPMTELVVHEPAPEQLTGREAHDRVQAILDETLDRDLWKALRLEQGADLQQVAFGTASLGRALDLAAGASATDDAHDDLWAQVVAERDRYWTATGKRSVDRVRLAERLEAAVQNAERCQAELHDLEEKDARLARLRLDSAELVRQVTDRRRQEDQLATQVGQVEALEVARDRSRSARDLAAATRHNWTVATAARTDLVARVDSAARALRVAESARAESQPALAAAERRRGQVRLAHQRLVTQLQAADRQCRQAQEDRDHHRSVIELEQLSERLHRLREAESALVAAETEIASATVSADDAEAIEQAELDLARAEAAATASAATVRVEAHQDVQVRLDGATHAVGAGSDQRWRVAEAAEVELAGVARLTIEPGSDARALAARATEVAHRLRELCARAAVTDSREARRRVQDLVDAQRIRGEAEEQIRIERRDLTAQEIQGKVEGHRQRIAEYVDRRRQTGDLPPDFEAAKTAAKAAEGTVDALRERLRQADDELKNAEAGVQSARETDLDRDKSAGFARDTLAEAGRALEAARAEATDQELADQLVAAQAAHQETEAALAEQTRLLAAQDPESLRIQWANASAARQRAEVNHRETSDECTGLQRLLEHTAEQGLAHRLNEALTERDRLQVEVDRLEGRAEAARLLHETFERRRAAARSRYVAPFKEQIERLGRLVFGPSLQIELDHELRIASRTLDGTTVRVEQLSTGAREQLGMLARLACAAIVAGHDGAPVIFDDALGWTDPVRLAQMAAAISVASRNCQVVILTCTPGRFSGIGDATVVKLPPPGTTPARSGLAPGAELTDPEVHPAAS